MRPPLVLSAALILATIGASSLFASPAAYLVFEMRENPGDEPRPVFYREVDVQAFDGLRHQRGDHVEAAVIGQGGALVHRARVPVHGVRLEGPDADPGELRRFPDQPGWLVLRIPREPGGRLELRQVRKDGGSFGSAAPWTYDLDALAASADLLPLAAQAKTAAPAPLQVGRNSGNRVDLLVMGDGFVHANDFAAATHAAMDQFFEIDPYATYRDYFYVEHLFTPSAQNGADHPPYRAGCANNDLSCCPEDAALGDPLAGTYVNTAFDARFCANGAHRLLVVNRGKAFAAASAFPDWDTILLMVNDPVYGGSGGSGFGVFSSEARAVPIAQHEFGHSFTGLADEYESSLHDTSCSEADASCEVNVTDRTSNVKWSRWIPPGTPLPTPEDSGYLQVGLFEGARYNPTGLYRPKDRDCIMRQMNRPFFCEVCREEFVLRLYGGGWGNTEHGLALIEWAQPGGSQIAADAPVDFSLGLLPKSGERHQVEWRVDGALEQSGEEESFRFAPAQNGSYQVEALVRDATDFVHPTRRGEVEQRRSWTLRYTGAATAGTLGFAAARVAIAEAAGVVQIRVDRTDGGDGAVGVSYAATAGNAAAGVDYTAVAGQLAWPDGDVSPRFFAVPILDDTLGEEHETLTLALADPTGGAELGLAVATLEIVDDEVLLCTPDPHTLCLGEGRRFRMRVGWKDFQGAEGPGSTWEIGKRDSGLFYFFDANNIELLVKALDGCGINQRFWLFYAATTNVEFALEVLDTATRERKVYRNTLGQDAPPVLDTGAFAICP